MSSTPTFAVILSGCGVYDGSEIHEAVMTLLAIDDQGGSYQCFAPDKAQMHVIDHLKGEETGETRNVLTEAARIARGDIKDLADFDAAAFDAIIFPGGFGAAKNLSDFAVKGAEMSVDPTVERAISATRAAGKPVGALCISPAIMARAMDAPVLTIGKDPATAETLEKLGAKHEVRGHGEIVIDEKNGLVTTPCYMLEARIGQIREGAFAVVKALIEMIRAREAAPQRASA